MPRVFNMNEDSRTSLLVVLVFIVLAISPTPKQGQDWPKQRGIVESLTPQTRRMTTTSGQREFLQQRQPSAGFTMVPVRFQDEIGSLPSAALPEQKPLESRIASILEFVDSILFDSSLSEEDTESILKRVHSQHRDDFDTAKASYLEVEERDTRNPPSPFSFDRIGLPPDVTVTTNPTLAIRSTEPILDISSVNAVKEAAEDVWKAEREGGDASKSRFTYQYSGNSEAHVFDFITTTTTNTNATESAGKRAISALNEALQRKIYPTIREAFFQINGTKSNQGDKDSEDDDGTLLFVYDALVIRYNSTKAAEAAEASGEILASAGQPLHRDLGLVSVNVMLNSAENFEGGGTFFENQLLGVDSGRIQPLKPSGVGYCLAHSASDRHAGAGTTTGVRDILVLFVSAATRAGVSSSSNEALEAPAELLSARLKNCRTFCEGQPWNSAPMESEEQWMEAQRSTLLCRILHQRLAVTAGPKGGVSGSLLSGDHQTYCDGEALQYLGTALMEYSSLGSDASEAIRVLEVASECFTVASLVTPCDSRVYNNLGIVLGRIHEMEQSHGLDQTNDDGGVAPTTQRLVEQETAYRKGLDILQRSIQAGCTNESLIRDLDSLSLNYGLFLANQDRFHDAAEVLEPVAAASSTSSDATTGTGHDAFRLWKYCRDRSLEDQTKQ